MRVRDKVLCGVAVLVVATVGFHLSSSNEAHPATVWYCDATSEFRSSPDAGDLPDLRMCAIKSAETGITDRALIYRETRWTGLRRALRLGGGLADAGGYLADGQPMDADGRRWQRFVLAQD